MCLLAYKLKKIKTTSRADPVFVSISHVYNFMVFLNVCIIGFSNWKDATVGIHNHKTSSCHVEAVEVLFKIPSTTADIGELMSLQHVQQKLNGLHEIFITVKYLCRLGLPLRGDIDEEEKDDMKAEKHEILANCLKERRMFI